MDIFAQLRTHFSRRLRRLHVQNTTRWRTVSMPTGAQVPAACNLTGLVCHGLGAIVSLEENVRWKLLKKRARVGVGRSVLRPDESLSMTFEGERIYHSGPVSCVCCFFGMSKTIRQVCLTFR